MDYRVYFDFIKFCLKNDANILLNVYSIAFEGISRINDMRIPNDVLYNWLQFWKLRNRESLK